MEGSSDGSQPTGPPDISDASIEDAQLVLSPETQSGIPSSITFDDEHFARPEDQGTREIPQEGSDDQQGERSGASLIETNIPNTDDETNLLDGDGNCSGDGNSGNNVQLTNKSNTGMDGMDFDGFNGPFSNPSSNIKMVQGEPFDPNYPSPAQYVAMKYKKKPVISSRYQLRNKPIKNNNKKRVTRYSDGEEEQEKSRRSRPRRLSDPSKMAKSDEMATSTQADKSTNPLDGTFLDINLNDPAFSGTQDDSPLSGSLTNSSERSPMEEGTETSSWITTLCIRTLNNSRIFNNPRKLDEMINSWSFKNYTIPETRSVPGNGSCFIIQMNMNALIEKVILKGNSFLLNEHRVVARVLDNPEEEVNYFRFGPISTSYTIEELKEDLRLDNNSKVVNISWIGTINERSNDYGKYLKVKVHGSLPNIIKVAGTRYTPLQYTIPILRCGNCLDLGHSDVTCNRIEPRCSVCSGNHHSYSQVPGQAKPALCSKTQKCFQCMGNHRPTAQNCPKNIEANNIHKQMVKDKVSLKEINKKLREIDSTKYTSKIKSAAVNSSLPSSPSDIMSRNIFQTLGETNLDDTDLHNLTPNILTHSNWAPKTPQQQPHFHQGAEDLDGPDANLQDFTVVNRKTTKGKGKKSQVCMKSSTPPLTTHNPPAHNPPAHNPPTHNPPTHNSSTRNPSTHNPPTRNLSINNPIPSTHPYHPEPTKPQTSKPNPTQLQPAHFPQAHNSTTIPTTQPQPAQTSPSYHHHSPAQRPPISPAVTTFPQDLKSVIIEGILLLIQGNNFIQVLKILLPKIQEILIDH